MRTARATPADLLDVYESMGRGERFSPCLAAATGLSVEEFEERFYTLMQAWLEGGAQ